MESLLGSKFEICNEAKSCGLIVRYDQINYRGQDVLFLSDVSGDQCFGQWNNKLYDLGLHNIYFKEDMCRVIDHELDLISTFRNSLGFIGAKLEWFNNGGHRDIKLTYRGRILKVFLVAGHVNEIRLISDCEKILKTSGFLEDL